MRSASPSDAKSARLERPGKSRARLLFWAAMCSFLIGLGAVGEPLENLLRDVRNVARKHAASGEIVIVAVDGKGLEQVEDWPWPRRHHGALVDRLHDLQAKEIFFDIDFSAPSDEYDDSVFTTALANADRTVTLPAHLAEDQGSGTRTELIPHQRFRAHVDLASISVRNNFRGEVRVLSYRVSAGGKTYPSFAAKMAGVSGPEHATFPIDFAIDPRTVPVVSAADLISGRVNADRIAGKKVIVAATAPELGDKYLVPGHGLLPGVYLHVLGAETLIAGMPIKVGWLLPLMVSLIVGCASLFIRDVRFAAAHVGAVAVAAILLPGAMEARHLFPDIVPSLIFLFSVCGVLLWASFKRSYRTRGSVNSISGLPNFNVLRQDADGLGMTLVVAKVHNYAEIALALTTAGEEALVRQIAQRLSLISLSKLYQSDEGIFAWFADSESPAAAGEYLNSVFEIFRSPLTVMDSQVDTNITFGLDGRKDQPLAGRLGSAVVAADDAFRSGMKWKEYDPSQSDDIAWKLSLLSQLDQAIDTGDLWIAFQPKMDVASRKVIGAEALARWDHPEKGAINPIDFILAAEQSGRIGKLTDYVLERAVETAALLNNQGYVFNVAVNLSARLIDGISLTSTVARLLKDFSLDPKCLTLEITETAALAGAGRDLEILTKLRKMGVQLSIDDYGTGLSTLDYMKRIPATEIKIDKSFIEAIERSRSDRLMVHSTIQLAHSLGQKVVAEGVERAETLEMLALMGCDVAQGYLIGHPVPADQLRSSLANQRCAA